MVPRCATSLVCKNSGRYIKPDASLSKGCIESGKVVISAVETRFLMPMAGCRVNTAFLEAQQLMARTTDSSVVCRFVLHIAVVAPVSALSLTHLPQLWSHSVLVVLQRANVYLYRLS